MKKRSFGGLAVLLLLAAVIMLLPLFNISNYLINVIITCLTFASLATAWNIVGGYAAQVSWAHASFVAIGSYSSFILYLDYGVSPYIGMLVGMAISVVFAAIIGACSFRLRGPFFSLSTIAFAEIVRILLLYFKSVTGGNYGRFIVFEGRNDFAKLQFVNNKPFLYIMLGILAVVIFIAWLVERSKTGYYLRAIKADEDAAESLGIRTYNVKLIAFVISAAITSCVGTFYAYFITYIDPTSVAALAVSTKIGAIAIVGGVGTLFGPLIGAFLMAPIAEIANIALGSSGGGMLIYGLMLIIITMFKPDGIISFFTKNDNGTRLKASFFRQKEADKESENDGTEHT